MRRRPSLLKFALIAFAFTICIIFLLNRSPEAPPDFEEIRWKTTGENVLNVTLREAIAEWKQCIEKNFDENKSFEEFWDAFTSLVNDCTKNTAVRVIMNNAFQAWNNEEVKYHVLDKKNSPAVVVTLGVGRNILAEELLLKKLPKGTEFIGADPIYDENSELFQTIGKFYPFAVGATTGSYTASVYKNDRYRNMEMTHISLVTFLRDIVNRTRIDQLLMDNEYAEYDLLPQFTRAAELDAAAIQVCQLNTELHLTRGRQDRKDKFVKIVKQILHGDRWLPLFVDTPHHHRVFLVNYETKYCRETYLEQFFVSS